MVQAIEKSLINVKFSESAACLRKVILQKFNFLSCIVFQREQKRKANQEKATLMQEKIRSSYAK
jgi:hypothetical protein